MGKPFQPEDHIPVLGRAIGKSGESNKCLFHLFHNKLVSVHTHIALFMLHPGKNEASEGFKDTFQPGKNTQGGQGVCTKQGW